MFSNKCSYKKYIYIGIVVICLLGTGAHFLYELSGGIVAVGILAPINESIWEHMKLAFYPTILWWMVSYFFIARKNEVTFKQWLCGLAISSFISTMFIPIFYYTYTGTFGIHSMVLDVSSLFIGVILGQLAALMYLKKGKENYFILVISILWLVIGIAGFTYFTLRAPDFPIFIDASTGKRGLG